MKIRNATVDAAKGIGILLVFLGHIVPYGSPLFRAIFNFHMPLFFLLSGCFFRPDDEGGARRHFNRILVNIGLPIAFFTIAAVIVSIFCPPGEIPHKDTYPYWLIYCVSTWHAGPPFVTNIWFLFCLAGTQAVAWKLWPWCRKSFARLAGLMILCVAMAYGIGTLDLHYKHLFPLMSSSVPMALVFFLLGYIRRDSIMKLDQKRASLQMVGFASVALLIEVTFAVFLCSESPNLAVPDFPSWWTFPIASSAGIFAILLLGKIFQNPVLAFLGRNSLYLFMMEAYASRLTSRILRLINPTATGNPILVQHPWHNIAFQLVVSILIASLLILPAKGILAAIQNRFRHN